MFSPPPRGAVCSFSGSPGPHYTIVIPFPHFDSVLLHSLPLWSQEYLPCWYLHPPSVPSLFFLSLSAFRGESSTRDPFISAQSVDFKSPKVCFPILSLPGNYSPRSPRGHPNSRHKRWLFPGCGWTFAYSIPQPMCSPLLKHGASSPPRPTSPRKASPLSLAEGVSLCHEGLAYSTSSSRTHPRGQMCPPCTLKNICFLLRCQRLLFIYF